MKAWLSNWMRRWRQIDRIDQLCADVELLKKESKLAVPVSSDVILTHFEGFILSLPATDHGMVASYVFNDNIEQGVRLVFRALVRENMTVIDVGAHIGIYTLLASSLVGPSGKVISFEPNPTVFRLLRDNVERTAFRSCVTLHACAVSDQQCERTPFAVFPDSGRDSSLYPDDDGTNRKMIDVPTVMLDEQIPEGQRVDVVKIDAEGAEPAALRGMRRLLDQNPDILIFMEFAPVHLQRAGTSPESLLQEIQSKGFHIYAIHDFECTLHEIAAAELLQRHSANLLLSRKQQGDRFA